MRRRKNEPLHPETRATSDGRAGRNNATRRQLAEDIADHFTAGTAARTSQSGSRGKGSATDHDLVTHQSVD
jgi:hypothetical protein